MLGESWHFIWPEHINATPQLAHKISYKHLTFQLMTMGRLILTGYAHQRLRQTDHIGTMCFYPLNNGTLCARHHFVGRIRHIAPPGLILLSPQDN
jgi:hypothetical protein